MVEKLSPRVSVTSTPGFTAPSATTSSKATQAARSSVVHLQAIEGRAESGGAIRKGVAAALLGFSLVGVALTPAQAQEAQKQLPVTTSAGLFLDASQLAQTRYGSTDYDKLFGKAVTGSTSTQNVFATAQQQTVDARTAAAFDAFNARMTVILQRDAGSLASGLRPLQSGDTVTAEQQKQMERAFSDLLQNVPIGAFSPGVQNSLESGLAALGDRRDLSTTTLKELGKIGGDAVSDLVKDFKKEHPKAFWSMAGAGAAAAVVVGYTQGTDALEKLGIKPEVKTTIFDDVKLKVGLEAGKRFSDPRVNVGVEGQHTFQNGTTVRGGVSAQIAGKQLSGAQLDAGISTASGFNADGAVRFDGSGKPFDARLSASQRFTVPQGLGGGTGAVFANGTWSNGTNGTADAANLSVGLAAQHGRWTTSVSGAYDFKNDTWSSSLATGRTFDINTKNDLDLQIRGSVDSKGNGYIGAGVTFRF